jgi:hypothetical protein
MSVGNGLLSLRGGLHICDIHRRHRRPAAPIASGIGRKKCEANSTRQIKVETDKGVE